MLEITPLTNRATQATRIYQAADDGARPDRGVPETRPSDRVELSDAARDFTPETDEAQALAERLEEIRAAIRAGTYVTADKLDVVIDQLHTKLLGDAADQT